jgi:hypothetical protein
MRLRTPTTDYVSSFGHDFPSKFQSGAVISCSCGTGLSDHSDPGRVSHSEVRRENYVDDQHGRDRFVHCATADDAAVSAASAADLDYANRFR